MNIRILDAAQQDLVNGYRFYEAQTQGGFVTDVCPQC